MPQMAPMNWFLLYFIFSIIFLFMNSLFFHFFIYAPKLFIFKKKNNTNNWKW